MKYQIIRNHESKKGGVNNIYVAQVLNSNLNIVKSFRSKVSFVVAEKAAKNWVKKQSTNTTNHQSKKTNGSIATKNTKTATKKKGLKKPNTKGLVTLCAKTVGVTGRRKKDGTQKKGYVATKGGALKKKTAKK